MSMLRRIGARGLAIGASASAVAFWGGPNAHNDALQASGNPLVTHAQTWKESGITEPVAGDEGAEVKPRGRRHLLKSRTRHKAKLEEEDQMTLHLHEYKDQRAAVGSLKERFDLYASKTIEVDGKPVKVMTFTNFLHSLILPRFHSQDPRKDLEYSCDFVGNANGLITYEECYLLLHLLQIPQEHFDVAFCMFDLDGDGTVDKQEFAHVIENFLNTVTLKETGRMPAISVEATLPRLTKYLFGMFGTGRIKAKELDAVLDDLRKLILRAEFDLYAKPHPTAKKEQVISVHDFAITLISCFDPDRLPDYFERVHKLQASNELVTWDDFYKFHFNVQSNLEDIKLAFELIGLDEITEADFIRAAHVVTGVELTFPVVQLAFRVFDSNENCTLDQAELFRVLELRNSFNMHKKPMETRLKQFLHCVNGSDD